MNEITKVEPRKFNTKVLCCALGLIGVVSGGDAKDYDARPDPMVQARDIKSTRTLGVCFPAPNHIYSLENVIEPIGDAKAYLDMYEHQTVNVPATTTVLRQPKHGILRLVTEADGNTFGEGRFVAASQLYAYLPENGYVGKDRAGPPHIN